MLDAVAELDIRVKAKNFQILFIATTCFGFPLIRHKQRWVKLVKIKTAKCVPYQKGKMTS